MIRRGIRLPCGWACPAFAVLFFVVTFAPDLARGDISVLGVTGPHSGTGFANLGAVTKDTVTTTMANAEVLIEIQGRKGDDLTATCTAIFDFETEAAQAGQTLLVAFPVTGFGDEAVKISQFEVVVDGVRKPELHGRAIQLFSGENGPNIFKDYSPVEANPDAFKYLGFRLYGGVSSTSTLLQAYVWSQDFLPGKHCRAEIKYGLTLRAQSLAYAKKLLHGESPNVVPFDAMWAGESGQKAFFLDYILRSGATWKGPIGHEKVTLRVARSSGITFNFDEVVTFGRHVFTYPDDLRDGVERMRVGVGADGVKQAEGIVWEIDHEKPQQDILVEIPDLAFKSEGDAKAPSATKATVQSH